MQRTFLVMRHAKSEAASPGQLDYTRSLTSRGSRDASLIAKLLDGRELVPQQILCSDAQRTRQTCERMLAEWGVSIQVEFAPHLYHGGHQALSLELPAVSDEVEMLMFLGHNPGCEQLIFELSDESATMKTAAVAILTGSCDSWVDLFRSSWTLQDLIYPRDLRQ